MFHRRSLRSRTQRIAEVTRQKKKKRAADKDSRAAKKQAGQSVREKALTARADRKGGPLLDAAGAAAGGGSSVPHADRVAEPVPSSQPRRRISTSDVMASLDDAVVISRERAAAAANAQLAQVQLERERFEFERSERERKAKTEQEERERAAVRDREDRLFTQQLMLAAVQQVGAAITAYVGGHAAFQVPPPPPPPQQQQQQQQPP
jgi:hypothetical protein